MAEMQVCSENVTADFSNHWGG